MDDSDGFHKDDDGKAPLSIIPMASLEEAAWVMEMGAEKYSRDNWRGGSPQRYVDAALRHIFAWSDPSFEDTDTESGRSHLTHALCCLLFAVHLEKFNGSD